MKREVSTFWTIGPVGLDLDLGAAVEGFRRGDRVKVTLTVESLSDDSPDDPALRSILGNG